MSFDLTIDRVGTLVSSTNRSNSPNLTDRDEVAAKFREQAEALRKSRPFADAEKGVLDTARHAGSSAEWITSSDGDDFDDDDQFIDIVAKGTDVIPLPHDRDKISPMLALLPSRRLRLALGGLNWIVRARPTVTSCALQKTSEPTKLWWTFEGIPQNLPKGRQPSGHDAAGFLAVSSKMAGIAMPLLSKAYWSAFKTVTGQQPDGFPDPKKMVRVCMSDANTREMAALLDAFFHHRKPSHIRQSDGDARTALDEFDRFVREVAGLKPGEVPADDSIEVTDLLRGTRGILTRQVDSENEIFLAGFARRLGARVSASLLPDDLRVHTKSESYLRAISAARPLSARIAEIEAIRLSGFAHRKMDKVHA